MLGEYVIWLLGKKGEGGENTKDRILDTTQIATKYTLQPECWVVVNTQGWILTLEKIRTNLTIDRIFFFTRKINLSSQILSMMSGKAFFCLLTVFYPNPVLGVPTVSVVFALLLVLLLIGCYLHWGPRSSEESSALQSQRNVHAGYQGPAGATGSRCTHSRGSSNPCWCMEATLSLPDNGGIGSARIVDVLHWCKNPRGMGRKMANGELSFHQQKLITIGERSLLLFRFSPQWIRDYSRNSWRKHLHKWIASWKERCVSVTISQVDMLLAWLTGVQLLP